MNGCVCSPKSCSSEFKKLSELGNLPLDDLKYFNYDTCKSGDDTLYYIKGCANGFLNKNTQSCSGFWGDGAAANAFNCSQCLECETGKCSSTGNFPCNVPLNSCDGYKFNSQVSNATMLEPCNRVVRNSSGFQCVNSTYWNNFKCKSGYHKNSAGTACEVDVCTDTCESLYNLYSSDQGCWKPVTKTVCGKSKTCYEHDDIAQCYDQCERIYGDGCDNFGGGSIDCGMGEDCYTRCGSRCTWGHYPG